jgi:pyruvate,orthophosphate dikinase
MKGLPVTVRLLDPPLHEFIPHNKAQQAELSKSLGIKAAEFEKRAESLKESNPMMGQPRRQARNNLSRVTEMQARAIFESAAELGKEGIKCKPEIMIPVTCDVAELKHQKAIIARVAEETKANSNSKPLTTWPGL